jgi:hypothetical protein
MTAPIWRVIPFPNAKREADFGEGHGRRRPDCLLHRLGKWWAILESNQA